MIVLAVVLLLGSTAMAADVISVNLQGTGAAVGTQTAGAEPAGNWNDYTGTSGSMALVDDDDAATTASFAFSSSGDATAWAGGADIPGDPGSSAMLTGHIYAAAGTTLSGAFTGIPYAKYDLYVYYSSSAVTNTQTFTLRGTATSLNGYEVAGTDTALVESDGTINGNYVVFRGLTAANVTVDATAAAGFVYMNGFQIVVYTPKLALPSPWNGKTNVDPEVTLTWVRPFEATNVTYDVYLQTNTNFVTPVASGQTPESYNPDPDLEYSRTYYWRVDTHAAGLDITGATWTFTTMDAPASYIEGGVISVNFYDDPEGVPVGANEAGVVQVGNWTDWNIKATAAMSALKNEQGNPTTAGGTIAGGADSYAVANGMGNPGDYALIASHWYTAGSSTVALTGIPYAAYDLYVYYNALVNTQSYTIRGTSNSLIGFDDGTADTAFVDSQNGTVAGNYVLFKGLTASDITIDASPVASAYSYFNGFQIVQVWDHDPATGETDVSKDAILTWGNPFDVMDSTYDVYLQKDTPDFGAAAVMGLGVTSYDPDPDLEENNTRYYWQVVIHAMGPNPESPDPNNPVYDVPVDIPSPVWYFNTAARAINPNPANGAVEVHPNAILHWSGLTGLKHDVYFGTDAAAVANADINTAGIYQGRQDVAATSFDPYGTVWMDWSTTYYWRIDEVDEATEPDTINAGYVWSFTTIVPTCPVPPIGDVNNDCLVTLEDLAELAADWYTCGRVPVESCPF